MADSNIEKFEEELENAIEDGVELFKYYKEKSKEFQEEQKSLMNNKELKKELENKLKEKFVENKEFIEAKRKEFEQRKNMPDFLKSREIVKLATEKKLLKNNYEKKLIKHKQEYEKLSEVYIVNSDKKFLKEKEKIRKNKKRILSRIKIALSQLKRKMNDNDYKNLIKDILNSSYELSDNKTIRFKTLMQHLESAEISNEVAKTTKKIDELMTIGNVINRKKQMEIGIKKKEIEKLLKEYNKTNKISKELIEKEITKLVKSLNRINNAKEKEKITTKIDKLSRSLQNEMTNRKRKIKYEIQIKMQELKELEKSS